MTEALDATDLSPPSRLRATSETPPSSNDSKYGSLSPSPDPSRSPKSATGRSFGLGALLKRIDRMIIKKEVPDEGHLSRLGSREGWPLRDSLLPPPMGEGLVPKSLTE
jgi:hypothetical protein